MEFYEPAYLFRQKAIRRKRLSEDLDQGSSRYSCYNVSNNSSSSWLLNPNNAQDAEVMKKVCSLDRVNIKSNFWKIPDMNMNLTALAVSNNSAESSLLAISSANADNNLFIHELDSFDHFLTHHTTITLPNIHGLSWVPNTDSRFLISGNSKGYAHLVSIPRPSREGEENDSDESAEIVKRFNHRKHLKLVDKDTSIHSHRNTCISQLGFLSETRLVSCYDDALFIWNINDVESSLRPRPESISVASGIQGFDVNSSSSTTLALCGAFGISLFDTRRNQHNIPNSSLNFKSNPKQITSNLVKWHPTNEYLFASAHGDGVVRLWDVRKQDSFASITGHKDKKVTSMAWNGDDLFTGGNDGNIVHWDLTSNLDPDAGLSENGDKLQTCSMREGLASVSFDAVSNSLLEKINERQCGTLLPASNNKIVGISAIGNDENLRDCKILSIDGAAFLGLHCKIYDAATPGSSVHEKEYYSKEDLMLINQTVSSNTIVGSSDSLTLPLKVRRKTNPEHTLREDSEPIPNTTAVEPEMVVEELSDIGSFIHTDDFDFSPLRYSVSSQTQDVISLHSIDSQPGLNNTPQSSQLSRNNSAYTLSTVATLIEPAELLLPKPSSFNFFDLELERLCNELPPLP